MGCTASSPKPATSGPAEVLVPEEQVTAEYDIGEILGTGAFADVHKATDKASSKEYALKVITKKKMEDDGTSAAEDVRREIEIACSLNHTHIVQTVKGYETTEKFYIVMEPVVGGDLFELVKKAAYGNPLSWMNEGLCCKIFRQLLDAFKYLHGEGVMHGDMKPENILLTEKPPPKPTLKISETISVKLCDFGFAMRIGNSSRKIKNKDGVGKVFGTPNYCAPEVLDGEKVGISSDVWSLGILLYLTLCGELPVDVKDNSMEKDVAILKKGNFPMHGEAAADAWESISENARDMVNCLTEVNPKKRITVLDAFKHVWITSAPEAYRF